MEATMFQDFGM